MWPMDLSRTVRAFITCTLWPRTGSIMVASRHHQPLSVTISHFAVVHPQVVVAAAAPSNNNSKWLITADRI